MVSLCVSAKIPRAAERRCEVDFILGKPDEGQITHRHHNTEVGICHPEQVWCTISPAFSDSRTWL
jgi:hypothetical protein